MVCDVDAQRWTLSLSPSLRLFRVFFYFVVAIFLLHRVPLYLFYILLIYPVIVYVANAMHAV